MSTTDGIKGSRGHVEFGSFADCLESLFVLLKRLAAGEVVETAMRLRQLREHIALTGDPKSVTWLLPAIDAALGKTW